MGEKMRQGIWRGSPALVVSVIALFVALGGSVYAAQKARIDGKAIRAKSIPGNRLKPRSIAANRLKPGVLRSAIGGPLTGVDINELTLGQVPDAAHADSADFAQSAVDAQTALNAVNAVDAKTVNGHNVGCMTGTVAFAGACWESSHSESAVDAPTAARKCAARGGELPEALLLAAFAEEPGVNLDAGDEWSGDIVSFTFEDVYSVGTVSPGGDLDSGLFKAGGPSDTHAFRCVIPLVA
jgi:hypothetical protein